MKPRSGKYRRLLVLGLAIMVGGVALGVGLWGEGSTHAVDASGPLQTVTLSHETTTTVCALVGPWPPCYLYGYGDSEGVTYVSPGNLYVFSFTSYPANDSAVVELGGRDLQPIAETPIPCGLSPPPQYPNSGKYVFLPCATNGSAEIVVFNWSSASVAGIIPAPTSDPYDIDVAFDPTTATAYAAVGAAGEAGYLLTIDVATATVLANVSLPSLGGAPHVWAPGPGGAVVVGAVGGSSLFEIDPASASSGQGIQLGGTIRNFGADSMSDSLAVCVEPTASPNAAEFLQLDTLTLERLSTVTIPDSPVGNWCSFLVDPEHGDLYVLWGFSPYPVLTVNQSTGQIVGSFNYPDSILPTSVGMSYDSQTDTLSLAGLNANLSDPIEPLMATMDLEYGTSSQPSYSAFPGLGTSLPLFTVAAGLVVGGSVLMITIARKTPESPRERTPTGRGVPEPQGPPRPGSEPHDD